MSVIKNQRDVSSLEFLSTARKLQIFTIKKAVNFPKRYRFFISQPVVESAAKVHQCVKKGNSIYPTNQHEVQMRRDCFIEARAELYSLTSQLEIANEVFGIDMNTMQRWSELISTELKLIGALMKSDKSRFKSLL